MKLLFVSLFLPLEKSYHAGGRYVFELIRQLSQRHEIHLVTRVQEDEYPRLAELNQYCRQIHPFSYPVKEQRNLLASVGLALNYLRFSRFADRIIGRGGYDLVQVEWVETALLIRRHGMPMVLDAHDVITKPAERGVQQAVGRLARVIARLRYGVVLRVEAMIMGRFDRVVTLSEFDRQYLATHLPDIRTKTVPIPAGLDMTDRTFIRQPDTMLFLASFKYRATNVAGALWLYRQVFPLVRAQVPRARFIIAGYGPPEELTAIPLTDAAVQVTGFVDDLEQCYKEAAVFVAPILAGGGIIVKVLDALAAGTPVVTTSYGNEGVGATPGEHLLVADDPHRFAEAVISLLADQKQAATLAAKGQQFVRETYGLPAVIGKLEAVYRELV